jgi:hypothetical protein
MKSSYRHCGNINLRGKRTKMLACMCCDATDFRSKLRRSADIKEMRRYKAIRISA